ncbi:UNVERIFIED_CONTAM: UDP-glycosyltransferase 86A1 [Sesamum radiatum]|uniref:UDP-glycosyltransferase 86A1 n=1 Tax=Sesamum radiatum TaxID=300843 RepID=A0AAW2KSS1_SESRA
MRENQGRQSLKRPHFIIIPPPFQGHINPSVQLTLKLASRGFTVTFVNTEFSHDQIRKSRKHLSNGEDDDDIFAGSRESGLDIRYRTVSDGFPLSFDRSLHRDQFVEGRIHVSPAHVDDLVGKLMGSDPPPRAWLPIPFQPGDPLLPGNMGLSMFHFGLNPL